MLTLKMSLIITAPTGPPLSVTASPLNSREIRFTWLPPAPIMRNGLITNYTLNCSITATGIGQINRTFLAQDSYILSGFRPGTQYTCQLVATNSAGIGPPAEAMATLPEDSKLNS